MKTQTQTPETVTFEESAGCPRHGNRVRKCYTFGMYGYAEVWTFRGCRCAVAVRKDPVGILNPTATLHADYPAASGVAEMHKQMMNAKYR